MPAVTLGVTLRSACDAHPLCRRRCHHERMAHSMDVPSSTIQPVELPDQLIARATGVDAGIVVLPVDDSGEKAVYSEASVMLAKQLRELGADAEFADPSEDRLFEVKRSAEIIVAFVIGVAATASWDLMKKFLLRPKDESGHISVTYLELEEETGRKGKAWKVEGNPQGVVNAIDALREGNDGDTPG